MEGDLAPGSQLQAPLESHQGSGLGHPGLWTELQRDLIMHFPSEAPTHFKECQPVSRAKVNSCSESISHPPPKFYIFKHYWYNWISFYYLDLYFLLTILLFIFSPFLIFLYPPLLSIASFTVIYCLFFWLILIFHQYMKNVFHFICDLTIYVLT